MRTLVIFIFFILGQISFGQTEIGQFAVVSDKDGYVNIRRFPEIQGQIIDTLHNRQIVYCTDISNDWCSVDYHLSKDIPETGNIHKSRLIFIDRFDKFPMTNKTDEAVEFKLDTLKLTISKVQFNRFLNKLKFRKSAPDSKTEDYLESINGKMIWGTDGDLPKTQYGQFLLEIGSKKINLPINNIFDPNLNQTSVSIDKKTNTIYIVADNSDGAGGYSVLWVLIDGRFTQQITDKM